MSERRDSNTALGRYAPSIVQMILGVLLYVWGAQESGPLDNRLFAAWAVVWLAGIGLFLFGYVQFSKARTNDGR